MINDLHKTEVRVVLGIEYDGSKYHGWQSQTHDSQTIQGKLELALSKIADQPLKVICAGRTDSGVHATEQIIHFDMVKYRKEQAWVQGTNSYLPRDIRVRWCRFVTPDFHARFSAITRRYIYLIDNRTVRSAMLHKQFTWEYRPLNAELMNQAAQHLVGEYDFTSFRASHCQALTPFRKIHHLNIKRVDDQIIIDIQANAFLYHMVRNIAGVLLEIGRGDKEPIWAKNILEKHDRTLAGMTASPHGLYLVKIQYPEHYKLPNTNIPLPFFNQHLF